MTVLTVRHGAGASTSSELSANYTHGGRWTANELWRRESGARIAGCHLGVAALLRDENIANHVFQVSGKTIPDMPISIPLIHHAS